MHNGPRYSFNLTIQDSVAALRLEDIVMSPNQTVSRLLQFLNFPPNPLINDFITKKCTKESQKQGLAGRNYDASKIDLNYINKIQKACISIYDSLGYSLLNGSDKYYSTKKLPVLLNLHNETWTL